MKFKPEEYDLIIYRLGEKSPNMLVPWYLMATYAYYDLDNPLLSDAGYDWVCLALAQSWDQIDHMHKHLINRESLEAGTGYELSGKMPQLVMEAADQLLTRYPKLSDITDKTTTAPIKRSLITSLKKHQLSKK